MAIPLVQRLLSRLINNGSPARIVLACTAVPALLYLLWACAAALLAFRYHLPEPSLMMVDRHHHFIASVQNSDSLFGYWPLDDTLPQKAVTLAIAAEDRRFNRHAGVDILSIGRALFTTLDKQSRTSGASTIAMQVARLQGRHHRTIFHKIEECFTALFLTMRLGREGIMRRYLTIAPYGNRIAGINYAARRYLCKPLGDCTWAEMALLTALPNAPGAMNLHRRKGGERAIKRAVLILKRAREYRMIDSALYAQAFTELAHFSLPQKELRQDVMLHAIHAAHADLVRKDIVEKLDPANPTVRLTLDGELQDSVAAMGMRYMDAVRDRQAGNMAIIVLERKTGAVRVYTGSDFYFDTYNAGKIDYAQIPRSTGSLLKPFIYACGMEWNGFTAATLLTDIGLFFGDGQTPFVTENYDRTYLGPILYQCALANSRNVPAIQVLQDVGLPIVYRKLARLSLAPDDGNADYYGLGLAVGNLYSSLYQLCGAYLTLANEGKKMSPQWIADGGEAAPDTQIITSEICQQIQHILSSPQVRLPSFPRGGALEYPFAVAVKTGTSRGCRDSWCIGWSDAYLAGVWIGRHDNQSMKQMSGFEGAAPLLKEIFLYLHHDRAQGLENAGFPPPRSYKPFKIDNLTGELSDNNSPYSSTICFKPGTEPVTRSAIRRWMNIDKRNGLLATADCPGSVTEMRQLYVLPDIFKDWAEKQGLELAPVNYSPLCTGGTIVHDYTVTIIHPQHRSRLYTDPEMPEEFNTLTMNCRVSPRVGEVLWFVDGMEFVVAPYPYSVSWPLVKGTHHFFAQVPSTPCRSASVTVEVF